MYVHNHSIRSRRFRLLTHFLFCFSAFAHNSVNLDDIDLDTGRRLIEDFEEPTAADDDLLVEKKPWYKRPAKVISRVLA